MVLRGIIHSQTNVQPTFVAVLEKAIMTPISPLTNEQLKIKTRTTLNLPATLQDYNNKIK